MEDLTTGRLTIRAFERTDLVAAHRILNAAFGANDTESDIASWLEWSILSAHWFPQMHQFPYGDRAIALRTTGEVVGVAGFVPLFMPFDQIPELARTPGAGAPGGMTTEVGLFWAIDPPRQRQGFATEAATILIEHALQELRLWRVVATTTYDNHASQAVMRKAGMTLTRNPLPEPAWMQVVGVRYAAGHPSHGPGGSTR